MTAAADPLFEAELERRVAARTADLRELLSHLSRCRDRERRMLARQLHDSLGSSMTAISMHLSLLAQNLPPDHAVQQRGAQIRQLLMHVIETNRALQLGLWNDKLEFLGIKAALGDLVRQFAASAHLVARVSLPEQEAEASPEQALALLLCLEEGLRNIAAHAGATEVDVIVDDNDEAITLTVRDNGVGPATAPTSAPSHGLRLLRERLAQLGGSLRLSAALPAGAELTVHLPKPTPAPP
jgi:signal transduction histidine kinase